MQTFLGASALNQFVADNVTDDNSKQFSSISAFLNYSKHRPLFLRGFSYDSKTLVYVIEGMTKRKVSLSHVEDKVYSVRIETSKGEDLFRLTLDNALRLFSDFCIVGVPTKQSQLRIMVDRYAGRQDAN